MVGTRQIKIQPPPPPPHHTADTNNPPHTTTKPKNTHPNTHQPKKKLQKQHLKPAPEADSLGKEGGKPHEKDLPPPPPKKPSS